MDLRYYLARGSQVIETRPGHPDEVVRTLTSEPEASSLASLLNHVYRMGVLDVPAQRQPQPEQRQPWFSLSIQLGGRRSRRSRPK